MTSWPGTSFASSLSNTGSPPCLQAHLYKRRLRYRRVSHHPISRASIIASSIFLATLTSGHRTSDRIDFFACWNLICQISCINCTHGTDPGDNVRTVVLPQNLFSDGSCSDTPYRFARTGTSTTTRRTVAILHLVSEVGVRWSRYRSHLLVGRPVADRDYLQAGRSENPRSARFQHRKEWTRHPAPCDPW